MGEWTFKGAARLSATAAMIAVLGACTLFEPRGAAIDDADTAEFALGQTQQNPRSMPDGAVPLAPAVSNQLQKGDLGDMSVVVSDQGTQYSLGRPYTSALGLTCRPFLSVNQDNGVFRKTAACSDGARWFAIPPVLLSQGD